MYKPARLLVARMDYLPHLDAVCVMKVGAFGRLYSEVHRMSDLRRRPPMIDVDNFSAVFTFHRDIDRITTYENVKTGELFYFEKNGLWNWEGISHPNLDLNK